MGHTYYRLPNIYERQKRSRKTFKGDLKPRIKKVEREIAVTDEKIDEIVYGLYGITEDERRIIEGKRI